jgi:hypothetical protein
VPFAGGGAGAGAGAGDDVSDGESDDNMRSGESLTAESTKTSAIL